MVPVFEDGLRVSHPTRGAGMYLDLCTGMQIEMHWACTMPAAQHGTLGGKDKPLGVLYDSAEPSCIRTGMRTDA